MFASFQPIPIQLHKPATVDLFCTMELGLQVQVSEDVKEGLRLHRQNSVVSLQMPLNVVVVSQGWRRLNHKWLEKRGVSVVCFRTSA